LKKTVKIIQSILLLCIFLLFNSLFWVAQANQTEIISGNNEIVNSSSADFNTSAVQSVFNEEESNNYEKDFVAIIKNAFCFCPSSFTIKTKENTIESRFQPYIFVLQTDLPPPLYG